MRQGMFCACRRYALSRHFAMMQRRQLHITLGTRSPRLQDLDKQVENGNDLHRSVFEPLQNQQQQMVQMVREFERAQRMPQSSPRPPVVTIMGHVDHGKTTLLDYLRHTQVAAGEAGGITQHIGAFSVRIGENEETVTFLDTPGHAAFSQMRGRGANCTDIIIVCVAADDGLMPQTEEALEHARSANVPVIVAITKCDKDKSQLRIEHIKNQLLAKNIVIEELGGDVQCVQVSAKNGRGVPQLLESILGLAEILELKSNERSDVKAVVLESRVDKGRGPVATLLVQHGTLKPQMLLLAGTSACKVRSMTDSHGVPVKSATPSTPVEVTGWRTLPLAGSYAAQLQSETDMKAILQQRKAAEDAKTASADGEIVSKLREIEREKYTERRQQVQQEQYRTWVRLMQKKGIFVSVDKERWGTDAPIQGKTAAKEPTAEEESAQKQILNLVVKSDVSGSLEALTQIVENIDVPEVAVKVVHSGVGNVTESDLPFLAAGEHSAVLAFNVQLTGSVAKKLKQLKVRCIESKIIYQVVDGLREAMSELLEPMIQLSIAGKADVKQIFTLSSGAQVAGCAVREGLVQKSSDLQVVRKNKIIHEGKIRTLKVFKDDVIEVKAGLDCGIAFEKFSDLQTGDVLQAVQRTAVKRQVAF